MLCYISRIINPNSFSENEIFITGAKVKRLCFKVKRIIFAVSNNNRLVFTNLRRYYKSAQLLQICAQQGLFPKIVRTPPYLLLRISIFRNCTPLEYHQNFHHPLDFFCFFLFIILLETLGNP